MGTASSVTAFKPTATTLGATGASRPEDTISARSLAHVTDSSPADVAAPAETIGVEAAAEASTGTLVIGAELVPSDGSGADNHSTVVAQAPDTGPSTTSTGLVSGLLSAVGVGSPLSTVDGPVQPLPGVILVGSLNLVRRDLERMNDDQLAIDTQHVTNTLTVEVPPEELVPVATTTTDSDTEHPSWSVPDELTVEPTAAERAAAFYKAQAERTEAFAVAQEERTGAFNEQIAAIVAQNTLGAIVATAAHVVTEIAYVGVHVVTEILHYASYAITEFIHGLTDWFREPAVFTGMYGDPETNKQYWQAQSYQNCVLMSSAMIINQLKNTPEIPDEEAIILKAQELESVVNPGNPMYVDTTQDGVNIKDAVKLLDAYGVAATVTEYDKTEGNLALRAVAFALEEKKAVSVGLHGETIWSAVENRPMPTGANAADHQVVVTGIDFDERVVYLNDSGFAEQGKNMKVPLDAFMKAWQTDDYETIIAELKQPNTSETDPGVRRISSPDSGVLLQVA